MTYYFLDSSAFGKLFIQEAGSDRMIALVEATDDNRRVSSVLIVLEVRSAIRRRQFSGDLSLAEAEEAISALTAESSRLRQLPADERLLRLALRIVDTHNLRALDSAQLATALLARMALVAPDDLHFVACDRKLLGAAQAEGFTTWNPAE